MKQQADLMISGFVANPERYKIIDISVPVLIDPYHLVVPRPKEESRLLAPVRPFQPIVSLYYSQYYILTI